MKRINRCNKVKLLSAARCCAKAIIDVAAVKFWFGAVKFVEKLLRDEADKKVSITRSHFMGPSYVNLGANDEGLTLETSAPPFYITLGWYSLLYQFV